MADEEIARKYSITGRVQGVGFRWFTRQTADRIGVDGWVKNLRDGSVEVRASGTEDQLSRLEDSLREGPRSARVESVRSQEIEDHSLGPGFRIEH